MDQITWYFLFQQRSGKRKQGAATMITPPVVNGVIQSMQYDRDDLPVKADPLGRDPSKFYCPACPKSNFTRNYDLKRHQLEVCGVEEKLFKCSSCGKAFSTQVTLDIHARIHTGYKYVCTKCNAYFDHKSQLSTHKPVCPKK